AAAGLVLTACTQGTLPLDASSPSSPASRPPTSLATSSPPLRAPTTLEARCFRMDPRIARIRALVERFRSSARSTARIARLHVAARRPAGEPLLRSDLARRGAFAGGDA